MVFGDLNFGVAFGVVLVLSRGMWMTWALVTRAWAIWDLVSVLV